MATCQDADIVASIAVEAAARLPASGDAACALYRQDGAHMTRVASAGPAIGTDRLTLATMPAAVRAAYDAGETSVLTGPAAEKLHSESGAWSVVVIAPVPVQGQPDGVLLLAKSHALDGDLEDTIARFALEVGLAIDRAEMQRSLASREQHLDSLLRHSSDGVLTVTLDGTILFANDTVHAWLGDGVADLVGTNVYDLLTKDDRIAVQERFIDPDEAPTRAMRFDCDVRVSDDQVRSIEVTSSRLPDVDEPQFVLNVRDVTERRRLERELAHQAFHDSVTGLANRALFADRITHASAQAARSGSRLAVALIDLDDFKSVNDSLGHDVGDELLVTVAQRISSSLRAGDTAARLGGDEFAVLLDPVRDAGDAVVILRRVLEVLESPVVLSGREIPIRASIGMTLGGEGASADDLIRDADAAMYAAKGRGKHRVELFEPHMHGDALRRLELRADLERALERDELEVHYQPVTDLQTRETVAVEALLRWRHPERGLISPAEFIPLAEQSGLIIDLGRWALRTACAAVAEMARADLGLHVNVSARELQEPGFPDDVITAVQASGLGPERLILEVTETAILADPVAAGTALQAIRGLGVRVAVDDFGTGHSSLMHLQHLPIDMLKVDKMFVQQADDDGAGARLIRAIEQLATVLGLQVVAEGVETEQQAGAIRALGYPLAQGFLFARPMPHTDLETWLRVPLVMPAEAAR